MLTEWRLHQFKSVGSKQRLDIAPLTVFAGANSSGKSTIIQSILLIAQTLTSKVADRPLILNGELAKLGTFDDVLQDGVQEKRIGIGFSIRTDVEQLQRAAARTAAPYYYLGGEYLPYLHGAGGSASLLRADLFFTPKTTASNTKAETLQAQLNEAIFSIAGMGGKAENKQGDPSDEEFVFRLARRSDSEVSELWTSIGAERPQAPGSPNQELLRFDATSSANIPDSGYLPLRLQRIGDPKVIAGDVEHFLPVRLVRRFNKLPRDVVALLDFLGTSGPVNAQKTLSEWKSGGEPARRAVANAMLSEQEPLKNIGKLLRTRYQVESDPLVEKIIRSVVDELSRAGPKQVGLEVVPVPPILSLLRQGVLHHLGIATRYLGPLRDDPKPLYAVPTGSDPSQVGIKGEFTASVLDLYENKVVDFVPPESLDVVDHVCLSEAVQAWVKYLGIADSVKTWDEGKLGHRLYIQPGGIHRDVDLTNVGVGVSQVLPILVTALISEPGATLLFEQPELHLHPKVQSRLADFFLAVMRAGRQCIIETHSEYLVNRLRLRVAESPITSTLNENITLYFVERKSGESHFRQVKINEYGAIPQWPSGFFDQGPDESDRILEAATRKRAQFSKKQGQ